MTSVLSVSTDTKIQKHIFKIKKNEIKVVTGRCTKAQTNITVLQIDTNTGHPNRRAAIEQF